MYKITDIKKQILYLIVLVNLFGTSVCEAVGTPEPPSIEDIPLVISKVVGMLLSASIVILVIIVGYGIIKASLASGDPRGIEGAKGTWTYAIYGFFIVFFSFVIYSIILKVLGISGDGLQRETMFSKIIEPLQQLIEVGQSSSSSGTP